MIQTWEDVRELVKTRIAPSRNPAMQNRARILLSVIDVAQGLDIDATILDDVSASNLFEITKEARRALMIPSRNRLIELFEKAVQLSNSQLRIYLRGNDRSIVVVEQKGSKVAATFYADQFRKIVRATRSKLAFVDIFGNSLDDFGDAL